MSINVRHCLCVRICAFMAADTSPNGMIQALSNLSCDLHEQMEVGIYYFHCTRLLRLRRLELVGMTQGGWDDPSSFWRPRLDRQLHPQPLSCSGTEEASQKGRMSQPRCCLPLANLHWILISCSWVQFWFMWCQW